MKWKCPLCGGNHRTFACPQFPVKPAPTVYVQGAPQCACRWSQDRLCPVHGTERPSDAYGEQPSEDAAANTRDDDA